MPSTIAFGVGSLPGDLRRLFEAMTVDPRLGEVHRVFIDSTIVRAHRHAAGAARKKHLGAAAPSHRQGIGRSRGGLSSKIVAVVSDETTLVEVEVVPGQAHDAPRLKPSSARVPQRIKSLREIVGDKAFSGRLQRSACESAGVELVSPSKRNAVDPVELDEGAYRERNRIERFFAKLKEFRRAATRYDKLKETFLGLIHLVSGFIKLQSKINVKQTLSFVSASTNAPRPTESGQVVER